MYLGRMLLDKPRGQRTRVGLATVDCWDVDQICVCPNPVNQSECVCTRERHRGEMDSSITDLCEGEKLS